METPIITLLDKQYLTGQTITDINQLFKELSPENPNIITYKDLVSALNTDMRIFIVLFKTRIIGMGIVCKIPRLKKVACEIHDVVVSQEHRGQGLGRIILERLIHEARTFYNAEYVELTSNPTRLEANQMYCAHGFEIRETNYYRLKL